MEKILNRIRKLASNGELASQINFNTSIGDFRRIKGSVGFLNDRLEFVLRGWIKIVINMSGIKISENVHVEITEHNMEAALDRLRKDINIFFSKLEENVKSLNFKHDEDVMDALFE